ncbi:hypothetical protein HYW76_01850 [Candidatus Pacearchaeota archaeon]|nr:hypothetical protein [Candidatus Pacearchaeota archaeon]
MITGKKGATPISIFLFVMFTFFIGGYALFGFISSKNKTIESFSASNYEDVYAREELFNYYISEGKNPEDAATMINGRVISGNKIEITKEYMEDGKKKIAVVYVFEAKKSGNSISANSAVPETFIEFEIKKENSINVIYYNEQETRFYIEDSKIKEKNCENKDLPLIVALIESDGAVKTDSYSVPSQETDGVLRLNNAETNSLLSSSIRSTIYSKDGKIIGHADESGRVFIYLPSSDKDRKTCFSLQKGESDYEYNIFEDTTINRILVGKTIQKDTDYTFVFNSNYLSHSAIMGKLSQKKIIKQGESYIVN